MTERTFDVSDGPARVDHVVWAGDDFIKTRTYKEGGAAADISGDDFILVIKSKSGSVLHTLEVGTGITLPGGVGVYSYALTDVQTAALPTNCALSYSLRKISAAGIKKTLERGTITVNADEQ